MQRLLSVRGSILLLFLLFLFCVPAHAGEAGDAYYDMGVFAFEEGDYAGAANHLKKALEFDPDNASSNHYLGKTYLKMGRYVEAEPYLDRAWTADPDIPGLKYDRAFLNYKTARYAEAADLFKGVADEEPSNVLASYYAGISLYQAARYAEAPSYLDSAAERSPTLKVSSAYYAGICHFKTGHHKEAVEKFEYVRDEAGQDVLALYAEKWLDSLEGTEKERRPYELYARLGYQFDDNVCLDPLDKDFFADQDDAVTVGYLSGKYELEQGPATLGAEYTHYQTWHRNLTEFDLTGNIIHLYGHYQAWPFTFGISYLPQYYWLDSESFLMRHQIRPEVLWRLSENVMGRLSYSFYRNNHFEDSDRDGYTNEVAADLYYGMDRQQGYAYAGIAYEDMNTDGPDFSYGQMKSQAGISFRLPWDITLEAAAKFYRQSYDNTHSLYNVGRRDSKYHGAISLERPIFHEWLSLVGDYSYTKNKSNIDDYTYRRQVVTLSLAARY